MGRAKAFHTVANRLCNSGNALAASDICPKADADQSTCLRNQRHRLVANVTRAWAMTLKAGMAHDQCPIAGRGQGIAHCGFTAMCDINHHVHCVHFFDSVDPKAGQARL